jgi:acetoin utilization deacetylase AcuC-like enzyme
MGGMRLIDADYGWVTGQLKDIARVHANNRLVSVLEGGYALNALGRSATVHVKSLSGL